MQAKTKYVQANVHALLSRALCFYVNTVANHRTNGGPSQQAFLPISYTRQRGAMTVSFVKPA